jgi:hypothetical protein
MDDTPFEAGFGQLLHTDDDASEPLGGDGLRGPPDPADPGGDGKDGAAQAATTAIAASPASTPGRGARRS